jgi:hypothetical protein|tara:strand:- start:464 stop:712 length:249 start_codon:yes stop_codon:yes gene_type:complete
MKKMLLILFCIPLFIFGQVTSEIKYSLSTEFHYIGITLNENDSFEFNDRKCTFIRSGKGTATSTRFRKVRIFYQNNLLYLLK